MKRVFLYAYDRQNLGDDLFVHTIANRYPDVQFYIWSDRNNRRTFAPLSNLKVIDKDSRLVHFLQKLRPSLVARYKNWLEKQCNAVVYIGGSIFMEYSNWQQICSWWEYEAKNRPFYVLGANFGPWKTEAYRNKMAQIFGDMQDVCFRDCYSKALFLDIDNVRQAPDILFGYPMPRVPVKEKQVFVSVINCAGRDESHGLNSCDGRYVANMVKLLKGYLEEGYSLVLASFCREEGDEDGIKKILTVLDCDEKSRIQVLCYDGTNAAEMTEAIAESKYVIASRFHGIILALVAGRPVIPIVYSDKTTCVLQDLGFYGTVFDIRNESEWTVSKPAEWSLPDEIKHRCRNHFCKLDQILKHR